MARKNNNTVTRDRDAERIRQSKRRHHDERHASRAVLGPGSEHLMRRAQVNW